jgi:hypothetical protein
VLTNAEAAGCLADMLWAFVLQDLLKSGETYVVKLDNSQELQFECECGKKDARVASVSKFYKKTLAAFDARTHMKEEGGKPGVVLPE